MSHSVSSSSLFFLVLKTLSIITSPIFVTSARFLELFRDPAPSESCDSWLEHDSNHCFLTRSVFFFDIFPVSTPPLTFGTLPAFSILASSDRSIPVCSPSDGFAPHPPNGFAPPSVFFLASGVLDLSLWLGPASS